MIEELTHLTDRRLAPVDWNDSIYAQLNQVRVPIHTLVKYWNLKDRDRILHSSSQNEVSFMPNYMKSVIYLNRNQF